MKAEKKKILIFVLKFPVITETFIEREISKLADSKKLDVVVLSLKRGEGVLSEDLKNKVFYRRLSLPYCFKAATRPWRIFGFIPFFSRPFLLLKSLGYAEVFREYKADLIYTHFMSAPSTIALIASKILGVPFVVSAHAKDVFVDAQYISQKVKVAKFVSVCNKHAFEYIKKKSGLHNTKNVYLLNHGLDFKKLLLIKTSALKIPGKVMIFNNGRFEEKKGQKYLIEASKLLTERKIPHIIYILGGGGSLYAKILKQIEREHLEENVKILGGGKGIPFEEVTKYYKSADLFVFPSIETKEGDVDGVANTLFEAAAFKLPIVATNAGSTCDFIENEKTGLIIKQKSSKDIADAVERLVKDGKFAKKLAENACKKAHEVFDLDKNIKKLEGYLCE